MKFHSLSARIAFMLAVAITLILGGAALLMDHLVDAEMGRRFDDSLVSRARAVATLVEVDADMDELQRAPSRLLLGNAGAAYTVQCIGGYRMDSTPAPTVYPRAWLQRSTDNPRFADLESEGHALRAVWFRFHPAQAGPPDHDADRAARLEGVSCDVVMVQSQRQIDDILFTIDAVLLTIPLLALVAVILLTPALVQRGMRPLAALGERMRSIGPAAPDERLPVGGTRELIPLVKRFNEVLERMQAGMMRERRFAGALAHETRTRLAELRALVDVERRYPSDRPVGQVLTEIGDISGELEDTVTGLLLLTRLEAGIENVQRQQVDIRAVVDKQVDAVSEQASRRHIRIVCEPPAEPVCLIGDALVLGIVIGNLLRNAVTYAPSGTVVHLKWDTSILRLANAAPDLTQQDVAQFGRRYWRKQTGESDGGHAGLGLSLAAAAATALGLGLRFELDESHELAVYLVWPLGRVVDGA